MIRVVDISKTFGNERVLDRVSIAFEEGKTNLIIGRSGSGKTVLIKCMVGLMQADSGHVFYDDVDFSTMSFKERRVVRKKLGKLFQGGALFDSLNVIENVMFPLDMFSDMSRSDKLDRANECLKRVNLENVNHLYPSELSGGMKKRVAIARAISNRPRYLFCDEPNSGLDPKTGILIDKLIRDITEEYQMTTIVNTHDMNSVMEIGDKVCFLHQGRLWWEGSRNDILHADNPELDAFVYATELMRTLKTPS